MATLVTLLDHDGGLVQSDRIGVDGWPLVGYQGDFILVSTPGADVGWGNRALKPGQTAVRVLPLAKVSKIILTEG